MITVLSTDLLVWAGRASRCVAQAAFALSPPALASLGRLCATTPHTVELQQGMSSVRWDPVQTQCDCTEALRALQCTGMDNLT